MRSLAATADQLPWLVKNNFGRVLVAVLDPKLLPTKLDAVIGDHYFELRFEVESVGFDENGDEVNQNFGMEMMATMRTWMKMIPMIAVAWTERGSALRRTSLATKMEVTILWEWVGLPLVAPLQPLFWHLSME